MSVPFNIMVFWRLKHEFEVTRGLKLTIYNEIAIKKCNFFSQQTFEVKIMIWCPELHRAQKAEKWL